jgi:hypothetical protein
MPKLRYVLGLICYLSIPAVVIVGVGLFVLIDPEMARGRATYVRDYQLLDMARLGAVWGAGGLALVLWVSCCYLVLKSRARSRGWLPLAAAGPFGFSVIAALEDRSALPGDRYQQFIRNLKTHWRVALEVTVFVCVWVVSYESVVVERELMIHFESLTTGTPVSAIVAQQTASSGMWAAGEGIKQLYLVPLLYLLWPIFFNLAGWVFERRSFATQQNRTHA